MYKKNLKESIERYKKLINGQLLDGILLNIGVVKDNPYLNEGKRDQTWKERECLIVTDKKWISEDCHQRMKIYTDIDDDTIPKAYPTIHFGESIYSAMLNADIKFVGSTNFTCSKSEALIKEESDIKKLIINENNEWVIIFREAAEYFSKEADGEFILNYIITDDSLNLAVELMGATEAYYKVNDNIKLLKEIMEFGFRYNLWFYYFQKCIFEQNNKKALGDDEFYKIYDKPIYSIDAYTLCDIETYKTMGFEYQQKLVSAIGGGLMHTHGTGIFRLLPEISKLEDISVIQVGRDLGYEGNSEVLIDMDKLPIIRKVAGNLPLQFSVSKEEFVCGIKNHTLPGGSIYICDADNIDEANKLAYMAKEYKALF